MSKLFRTDYKTVNGRREKFKTNEIYVWCAVNKLTGEVPLGDVRKFNDELDELAPNWEWQKFYLHPTNDAKAMIAEGLSEMMRKGYLDGGLMVQDIANNTGMKIKNVQYVLVSAIEVCKGE